jgi:hypothetical protein
MQGLLFCGVNFMSLEPPVLSLLRRQNRAFGHAFAEWEYWRAIRHDFCIKTSAKRISAEIAMLLNKPIDSEEAIQGILSYLESDESISFKQLSKKTFETASYIIELVLGQPGSYPAELLSHLILLEILADFLELNALNYASEKSDTLRMFEYRLNWERERIAKSSS